MEAFRALQSTKSMIRLFVITITSICLVSCSNDDFREPEIVSNEVDSINICEIRIDNPIVPTVGDTRTYYANSELENAELVWGVCDSIGIDITFVKEEDLTAYGVEFVTSSNTLDSITINFINGYRGGFVGFELSSDGVKRCFTTTGVPRRD